MKHVVKSLARRLPANIRNRILRVSADIASEEFLRHAYKHANAPNMEFGLQRLAQRGLAPELIVDVGAYHGNWSQMVRQSWPGARLIMVEANMEKQPILDPLAKKLDAELHFALLGPSDGEEKKFYVMESGSSVLPEDSPLDRRVETLQTRTLDSIVAGRRVDFLKLDVQGFELDVLRGATETLATTQAVLLEVSLIEVNKGAPLMAEVVGFMRERGFEVGEILEIHRRPLDQATNQVDLLFVGKDSFLLADTRHF